jgi:hypothetical protein
MAAADSTAPAPRDVSWAQDKFSVHVNVHVADATDVSMQVVDGKRLVLMGHSSRTAEPFRVQLELFGEVLNPDYAPRVLPKVVRAVLHKKRAAEWDKLVTMRADSKSATTSSGVRGVNYDWDLDRVLELQAAEHGLDEGSSSGGEETPPEDDDDLPAGLKKRVLSAPVEKKPPKSGDPASNAPSSTNVAGANQTIQNVSVVDKRPQKLPVRHVRTVERGGWSTATVIAIAVGTFGAGIVAGGWYTASPLSCAATTSQRQSSSAGEVR